MSKDPLERIAEALEGFVEIQKDAMDKIKLLLPRISPPTPITPITPIPTLAPKMLPDGEREKAVEGVLKTLNAEIEASAPKLLRGAMKDAMLESGRTVDEIKEIDKKLKKQKRWRLKRKKGCLFLEIGDGVNERIEEIHLQV